jgi:hypothetical protein
MKNIEPEKFREASPIACDASQPGALIEETVNVGNSSFELQRVHGLVRLHLENRPGLEKNLPLACSQIQRRQPAPRQLIF